MTRKRSKKWSELENIGPMKEFFEAAGNLEKVITGPVRKRSPADIDRRTGATIEMRADAETGERISREEVSPEEMVRLGTQAAGNQTGVTREEAPSEMEEVGRLVEVHLEEARLGAAQEGVRNRTGMTSIRLGEEVGGPPGGRAGMSIPEDFSVRTLSVRMTRWMNASVEAGIPSY
jgi:hypothetical protein